MAGPAAAGPVGTLGNITIILRCDRGRGIACGEVETGELAR